MPSTLRWRITAGDISRLSLSEEGQQTGDSADVVGPPLPNQVTVDVRACGLNFADVFACLGLYSATPKGEFTPGLEFSGVISAVGGSETSSAAPELQVGDRVFGVTRFGGYSTRLNIEREYVRRLPDHWSFNEGAAYPAQALTAYYGLVKMGSVRRGDTVLVHSAGGGTGLWAVRLCRELGALPVGTVGSASKVEEVSKLTGLPAAAIIDRSCREARTATGRAQLLSRAVKAAYGREGYDIVFDSLLGEWYEAGHAALLKMGRHVVFGAGAMTPAKDTLGWLDWARLGWQYLWRPRADPLNMISANTSVVAFNLIWLYEETHMVGEMFEALDAVTLRLPPPHVGLVVPFREAPRALRTFQQGGTVGKVVLEVGPHECDWWSITKHRSAQQPLARPPVVLPCVPLDV